jgi:hypothetical protein
LEGAPYYSDSGLESWRDPAYGRRIDDYYAPMI